MLLTPSDGQLLSSRASTGPRFVVKDNVLSHSDAAALSAHVLLSSCSTSSLSNSINSTSKNLNSLELKPAGVGSGGELRRDEETRGDSIAWLSNSFNDDGDNEELLKGPFGPLFDLVKRNVSSCSCFAFQFVFII